MIPHRSHTLASLFSKLGLFGIVCAWAFFACDKLPLLAPTESTITLAASNLILPVNGVGEIIATVIEQSGTPVHNGTLVTFTTTLGAIDPREARTEGGTVTARLSAGGQSGTAMVGAFSGGARAEELEISIGGAAAEQVVLSANPGAVSAQGGSVKLAALVTDASGNGLAWRAGPVRDKRRHAVELVGAHGKRWHGPDDTHDDA